MKKPIAIIAGEPNSISSEIIFKVWKLRKNFFHRPFIVVGSLKLLNLQKKYLNYKITIKEINSNFNIKEISKNTLPVYNIDYEQKRAFEKISNKSNKYILKCFDVATMLIKKNKVKGIINCPIVKETLFEKKYQGVTEFLAKKAQVKGFEVMLIYNKNLSVAPMTTHIPINQISKILSKKLIIKKVITINNFYKRNFNKKPNIAILGLNPHNFSPSKKSEEDKIILPAVKIVKKLKIKAFGPVSPDTSFLFFKKYKYDVIIGMYHDQVLTPFKALYKYDAINITLGLPYFRLSPDHGVAKDIVGKKIANPKSLMESIKFFNYIK